MLAVPLMAVQAALLTPTLPLRTPLARRSVMPRMEEAVNATTAYLQTGDTRLELVEPEGRVAPGLVMFQKFIGDRELHGARVYVMEKGRVRFTGTMAELDARPDVRDAYLAV